jgi:hypothetical protein
MKKFIKIKHILILFITIVCLVVSGTIVSCVGSKNKRNNKILAQIELDLLMFQIENKIINLNALTDGEYIDLSHRFSALVNVIGKVKSSREHYFRINFLRAPKTLDEMIKIIMDKENNIFKWELLPWQNMAFHMYGKDGEYNLNLYRQMDILRQYIIKTEYY